MQYLKKILPICLVIVSLLESKTFTTTKCIDVKSIQTIYIDKKTKVPNKICYFDYRGTRCHIEYLSKTIKEVNYYKLMGYYKGRKIFKKSLHPTKIFPINLTIFQKDISTKPIKKGTIKIESWEI